MQLILEGMGRALHTNLNARFKCDALKVRADSGVLLSIRQYYRQAKHCAQRLQNSIST
jgi:hypothetical protein